jgi:Transposase DDE domain
VVALSSGQEADVSLAKELTEYLPPSSIVIADKAYDSSTLREAADTNGITTSIPARSNRTTAVPFSAKLYRHRH